MHRAEARAVLEKLTEVIAAQLDAPAVSVPFD